MKVPKWFCTTLGVQSQWQPGSDRERHGWAEWCLRSPEETDASLTRDAFRFMYITATLQLQRDSGCARGLETQSSLPGVHRALEPPTPPRLANPEAVPAASTSKIGRAHV